MDKLCHAIKECLICAFCTGVEGRESSIRGRPMYRLYMSICIKIRTVFKLCFSVKVLL